VPARLRIRDCGRLFERARMSAGLATPDGVNAIGTAVTGGGCDDTESIG
jgi:hypothetical protein